VGSGAGRFSNATHQCQAATFEARDRDSEIELELDPTPATAVVVVTPSVSVCELGPSAVASALTSARAEVPWTCTSMSNCFWMSTCSWMSTSFSNSIANASRFVTVISSSYRSHARTHLASPPTRTTYRCVVSRDHLIVGQLASRPFPLALVFGHKVGKRPSFSSNSRNMDQKKVGHLILLARSGCRLSPRARTQQCHTQIWARKTTWVRLVRSVSA